MELGLKMYMCAVDIRVRRCEYPFSGYICIDEVFSVEYVVF